MDIYTCPEPISLIWTMSWLRYKKQNFSCRMAVCFSQPFWRAGNHWKTVFVQSRESFTSHVSKRGFQSFMTDAYLACLNESIYIFNSSRWKLNHRLRKTMTEKITSCRFPIMVWRGGYCPYLVQANYFRTRVLFCQPLAFLRSFFLKLFMRLASAVELSSCLTLKARCLYMLLLSFGT